jgi:hypothetical protein
VVDYSTIISRAGSGSLSVEWKQTFCAGENYFSIYVAIVGFLARTKVVDYSTIISRAGSGSLSVGWKQTFCAVENYFSIYVTIVGFLAAKL